MSAGCPHTFTRTNEHGQSSSCDRCGVIVFLTETRPCGECRQFTRVIGGGICPRRLMVVTESLHVTYKVASGTCWEPHR